MRKSFKEFIVEIANMEHDNYSVLSDLPQEAKNILLTEPPELDPWDLLNQAQAEQQKLQSENSSLRAELEEAREEIQRIKGLSVTMNGDLRREIKSLTDALAKAKELGWAVMNELQEHGPSIVPHLLDTDENAGERFRQFLRDSEGKAGRG